MAKVAALWGSSGSFPRPDGFVPRAGEDAVITGCSRESERGQGCRRSTIDMRGFTSLWDVSRLYGMSKGIDDLTYFEHYPPCSPSTFGYVYSAEVCRIGDEGEDFTLETDWGTMVVFGFKGFPAGFSEGVTDGVFRVSVTRNMFSEMEGTWFERNGLDLKIWTCWRACICLETINNRLGNNRELVFRTRAFCQFALARYE